MHLVAFLESSQDRDRVVHRRWRHVDRLEAPLQRRVLLDVPAVLVERGGAHHAQGSAREMRLHHVAGVHCSLRRAGAHHGVQLVHEHHEAALAIGDLLQHGLHAFLEFAPVPGSGEHGGDVEGNEGLFRQGGGHVAGYDALGETFGDGGLPYAGLPYQHGIVLGAACEDLDHAPDFCVPSDHRIQLAAASHRGKIAAVAREGLVAVLRGLVGHPVTAANRRQRLQHAFLGCARGAQDLPGVVPFHREPEQKVFGGHIVVLECPGMALGGGKRASQIAAHARIRPARDPPQAFDPGVHPLAHGRNRHADLAQDGGHDPLFLAEQGVEKMNPVDLGAVTPLRVQKGGPQRLGRLYRQSLDFDHLSPCAAVMRIIPAILAVLPC